MKSIIIVLLVAALAACGKSEHRAAREKYNEGVDLLVKGDFTAAQKALLEARSAAGVDPELRFRAAYDLGMAYAAEAEKLKTGEGADLSKALEAAQQAVSWFSDAARLRKDDADTKQNLAIMRARAQSLSDELRKGEGKLEARLDALIAEQRTVLDATRMAWVAIKEAGGADPLAQQAQLGKLADQERGVVAEAGVIGDLTAEEIDTIGKKEEDKRTDEEKVRLVQLKNLELYLMDGRNRIAEARRKLQDFAAEEAVGRAEAALVALKRAREQLLDPITVLREVARDELVLLQETTAVAEATTQQIPKWLEPSALGERQNGLRDRVEEVRARMAAAVEGPPPTPPQDPHQQQQFAQQQKVLERVKVALPLVTEASAAMDRARTKLGEQKVKDAVTAERDALVALAKAIEQFGDLKQTIDLTSETQKQLVTHLGEKKQTESLEALAANRGRMTRIKDLIADEVAQLNAQETPKEEEKAKELEGMKAQMAKAEELRAEAEKLLGQLDAAIKTNKDPVAAAKATDAKLDELRRLFFSVIEHLQDLVRQQGETRDQTTAAHMEDDLTRAPKLPALSTRQDEHGQMAKLITDALAAQADQDPEKGKQLAAAADEVRLATNDMADAKRGIDKVKDATNQSFSLEPATKSQATAIEHLENALRLLQPPQQQQQQQNQDQQQQQQDKQQQQQPSGAGQRARDEDARRQRERQEREGGGDTVEKDW